MSFAYLPDRLADDPTIPLRLRVLIELQRRDAALGWTTPISATDLATQFDRSRAAVSRALRWAVDNKLIDRQPVSLPRGGRGWRYHVWIEGRPAPAPVRER